MSTKSGAAAKPARKASVPDAKSAGAVLDPITQAFVDELAAKNDPPIYTLKPEQARQVLETAQQAPAADAEPVQLERLTIPNGIEVTLFRPRVARGQGGPGAIYLHGGGWILGSVQTHQRLVRELAAAAGATIAFVDYARSPEARFPEALEQSYSALQYFAERGGEYGIDAGRLFVAGDSAGGNMATACAIMAQERGGRQAAGQLLFYPVTSAGMNTASYAEFAEGPWLTRKAMEWFWDAYAPRPEDRRSHLADPLSAPETALAGLPRTLIITAQADVLRDEGEAYAARLMRAGVPVTSMRYQGAIHDFVMLNALSATPAARHAIATAASFLSAGSAT